ncbi:MAG: SDR family NAD(P)-dependent oxidoreductase [Proteobacteria bacterium]|nr:SDR family NAD(P)-dependent oxidoreductase [Pseudomonadota bacterium]
MKTALVTGANRGLGFEISKQLGSNGFHIVAACRTLAKAKETVSALAAHGVEASPLEMDVSQTNSIQAAFKMLSAKYQQLDALVNNAGVLLDFGTPASELSLDNLRESFETNFFGAFATIQTFLPMLKKAPAARIVNMSSDLGSVAAMTDHHSEQFAVVAPGYRASKCALNTLTIQFANELANTNIKVNSASPGLARTDMGGENAPFSVEQGAAPALWLATLGDDGPTGGFFSQTLGGKKHAW